MAATVNETKSTSNSLRRHGLTLAGIILVIALPIRFYLAITAPLISRDGVVFIWYAQNLAQHPVAEMRRQAQHPLYPALILAMHKVIEGFILVFPVQSFQDPVVSWQFAAMAVTLIGGLSVIGAVYALTRTLFNPQVGLIAAAMTAMAAEFCQVSADALTDMPHLTLYLLAITCAIRGIKTQSVYALAGAGLLSGITYLLRPEGAEVAVITCIAALTSTRWLWRKRLTAAGIVTISALLAASPYMLVTGKLVKKKSIGQFLHLSHEGTHKSVLVRASANCTDKNRIVGATPSCTHHLGLTIQPHMLPQPDRVAVATIRNPTWSPWRQFASLAAIPHSAFRTPQLVKAIGMIIEKWARSLRVTLLLPAILWLILRKRYPGDHIGMRLVTAAMCLHLTILFALIFQFDYWELFSLRHVMILAGLTLPFSAAGVMMILQAVPTSKRTLLVTGMTLGLIGPTIPWMFDSPYADEVYLRHAGEWIRAKSETPPRIFTTRHRVAFYANGKHVWSPLNADVANILAELRWSKPDWVVFDERRLLKEDAEFFTRLEDAILPAERLEWVHVETQPHGKTVNRALIYRYQPPP